jgi:outer membrane protein assembly factor BamB
MKELLIFLISLGISMSQFLASMPDKSNPDWFCFGADAWHTCFVPAAAGPKTTKLELKWKIGNGTSGKPTIVDGRIYIGIDAQVKCLDAYTGKVIWATKMNGQCCRQIVYKEGKLYVYS